MIDGFYCLSEYEKSHNGDSISLWRSSNVDVRNGVVDGNNAHNGICVMFESSESSVYGGHLENVEARNCQGCFSGYPATDLTMINNTCAQSKCKSHDPFPLGGKKRVNFWAAGDNLRDQVYASNIKVLDSYYYEDSCLEDEYKLFWEKRKGELFTEFDVT